MLIQTCWIESNISEIVEGVMTQTELLKIYTN